MHKNGHIDLNKDELTLLMDLYASDSRLKKKEQQLKELLKFCDSEEHQKLAFDILKRMKFVDDGAISAGLDMMADFIVHDCGYSEDDTQVVAMTFDDEPDSAQFILNSIKLGIFQRGWSNPKLVNILGKSVRQYKKGRKNIIIVDEFTGTGQTAVNQANYVLKNTSSSINLKLCLLAGNQTAIDYISASGFDVFCPLRLKKGITEYYKGDELDVNIKLMKELELKLANQVNEYILSDYSFGFGGAEAMYTSEFSNGNTPNSTFPLFWWPRDASDKARNTPLTRYQKNMK